MDAAAARRLRRHRACDLGRPLRARLAGAFRVGGPKIEAIQTLRKFPSWKKRIGVNADDDLMKEIVERGAVEPEERPEWRTWLTMLSEVARALEDPRWQAELEPLDA